MNGIDAERNKAEESPEDAERRHAAREYRPGYFTGARLCLTCGRPTTEHVGFTCPDSSQGEADATKEV